MAECVIINIDAPDVDTAAAFYCALGFKPVRRLFGGAVAELALGQQLIHILPKPGATAAFPEGEGRFYERHWTPLHLDIVVKDLDAALAAAVEAGATIERAPAEHDWGRIAGLADPFGHGLCLVQLSDKGYDAVEG